MTMIDAPTLTPEEATQRRWDNIRNLQQRMDGLFNKTISGCVPRPVEVDGVRYESIIAASDATSIPEKSIRERCIGRQESYLNTHHQKVRFFARYVK